MEQGTEEAPGVGGLCIALRRPLTEGLSTGTRIGSFAAVGGAGGRRLDYQSDVGDESLVAPEGATGLQSC